MAITYTWKVTGIKTADVDSLQNAVVQTYWQKIGTDENGNTGTFNGATPFTVSSTAENFIPFENLTEEIVLGWIKEKVVGGYEEHVNEQILKMLTANAVKDATLPWAQPPQQA